MDKIMLTRIGIPQIKPIPVSLTRFRKGHQIRVRKANPVEPSEEDWPSGCLLLEDGSFLTLEDGAAILLE